jgi:hypothetical protein
LSASFTTASYLALFLFRRSAKDPEGKKFKYLEVSILIIATQVFSPLTWIAQLASLMIPAGTALLFASSATKGRRSIYAALALFAALSIVAGTDLTNFLPAIDQAHFPNIAIGAVFLAYALVRSYQS